VPGTSGLIHRDPCGEKAATSNKNANKIIKKRLIEQISALFG